MEPTIKMSPEIMAELHDWMAANPTREVCGLLGGHWRGHGMEVHTAIPIRNVDPQPQIRFRMDGGEQIAALVAFEKGGLDLVGIFHSHPHGPASPSPTDIAEATWGGVAYLIGVPHGVIRAWGIENGAARELGIIP